MMYFGNEYALSNFRCEIDKVSVTKRKTYTQTRQTQYKDNRSKYKRERLLWQDPPFFDNTKSYLPIKAGINRGIPLRGRKTDKTAANISDSD